MIIVSGYLRVPSEKVADLLPVARDTIAATVKEAGCIVYSFAADLVEPGLIRIYEEWESRAGLDAHGGQPHMTAWRKKLAEVGVTERKVTAFETGASRAL